MRLFVQQVDKDGQQTVVTLTTDVPAEDVSAVLFTPGDTLEFNRMGDRLSGSLFIERAPPVPGKRVINTAQSIMESDKR